MNAEINPDYDYSIYNNLKIIHIGKYIISNHCEYVVLTTSCHNSIKWTHWSIPTTSPGFLLFIISGLVSSIIWIFQQTMLYAEQRRLTTMPNDSSPGIKSEKRCHTKKNSDLSPTLQLDMIQTRYDHQNYPFLHQIFNYSLHNFCFLAR